MNPAAIFGLRSVLLRERLDWVGRALVPDGVQLDASQLVFRREIKSLRTSLQDGLKVEAGPEGWEALQTQWERLQRIFAEALAYLNATRRGPVDEPIQSVGSQLVVELAVGELGREAPPMIIPDLAESYSDYVPMIRMRFPAADIWELPAIAHEFGHWAAYRASVRGVTYERPRPLADLIERNVAPLEDQLRKDVDGQQPLAPEEKEKIKEEILRRKNWLNEFFADMFATYVLGYAYAAYALLLRFDLAGLYRDQGITHPPLVDRADAILFMLKATMRDHKEDRDECDRVAFRRESLSKAWSDVLQTLGPSPAGRGFEFSKEDMATAVASVAYDARFHSGRAEHETRSAILGKGPEQVPILARDLLYAAWISLVNGPEHSCSRDPVEIGARALKAWRAHHLRSNH